MLRIVKNQKVKENKPSYFGFIKLFTILIQFILFIVYNFVHLYKASNIKVEQVLYILSSILFVENKNK